VIPDIPFNPSHATPDSTSSRADAFTVRDGVQWLGIGWDTYVVAEKLAAGVHGGPLSAAILDARAAQSSATSHARPGIVPGVTTAEDVLSKYGIDPKDPAAAVREFLGDRSRTW
jgi:hypothetical protein